MKEEHYIVAGHVSAFGWQKMMCYGNVWRMCMDRSG